MTLNRWSTTAASNDDADSSVNWQEGQSPASVNNSARAMMAAIAKFRDDLSGNLVTAGTSTAYTLTTNQVFTSLTDGLFVRCRMSATSGATPTLNVDSLGAKSIASVYGTALPTGALLSGGIYDFVYDSTDDKWIAVGFGVTPIANGGTGAITAAAAATALGLGTGDSPQFTAVNIGAASDTTVSRASAGDIAVEGNRIFRVGGADVPLADGGTGASLADPGADRVMFWDESENSVAFLTVSTNLTLSGTTLTANAHPLTSGTAVTASGTSVDFGSIPAWVSRITIAFCNLSTNGTSNYAIQIGTGGTPATTGYSNIVVRHGGGANVYDSASTAFLITQSVAAAYSLTGVVDLIRVESSSNTWVMRSFNAPIGVADQAMQATGDIALAGALDIVRITTEGGANTFDAGTINILYE